jgi:hypothetical protein
MSALPERGVTRWQTCDRKVAVCEAAQQEGIEGAGAVESTDFRAKNRGNEDVEQRCEPHRVDVPRADDAAKTLARRLDGARFVRLSPDGTVIVAWWGGSLLYGYTVMGELLWTHVAPLDGLDALRLEVAKLVGDECAPMRMP